MHNGRVSKCSINITRNTFVNDVYEISHIRTACGNEINGRIRE